MFNAHVIAYRKAQFKALRRAFHAALDARDGSDIPACGAMMLAYDFCRDARLAK